MQHTLASLLVLQEKVYMSAFQGRHAMFSSSSIHYCNNGHIEYIKHHVYVCITCSKAIELQYTCFDLIKDQVWTKIYIVHRPLLWICKLKKHERSFLNQDIRKMSISWYDFMRICGLRNSIYFDCFRMQLCVIFSEQNVFAEFVKHTLC